MADDEGFNLPSMAGGVLPDGSRSRSSKGKLNASKNGPIKPLDPHRASTGSFLNGGRKSSSREPSSVNNGKSPVRGSPKPHYLSASTGSCHDFCKYGRKHEMEVKPWRVMGRKVRETPLNLRNGSEECVVPIDRKTIKAVKPKLSPVSKTTSPDPSTIFKSKVSSPSNQMVVPSRSVSSKDKNIAVNKKQQHISPKRIFPASSGGRESELKPVNKMKGTSTEAMKMKLESEIKPVDKTKWIPNKITKKKVENGIKPVGKTMGITNEPTKKKLVSSPAGSMTLKSSPSRVLRVKLKADRSNKLVSPHKGQNKIKNAELELPTDHTVKEKTLHVLEVEAEKTVLQLRETDLEVMEKVENESLDIEKVTGMILPVLKVDTEKLVAIVKQKESAIDSPPLQSLSSPKASSPCLTWSFDDEEGEGHIEQEASKQKADLELEQSESIDQSNSCLSTSSPINSPSLSIEDEEAQDEITCTDSEADDIEYSMSESSATVISGEEETYVQNPNNEPRKGKSFSEENEHLPTKLKFKRGKVVQIESNNSGPTRLKFRKGRILGENQDKNVKSREQNHKKGVVAYNADGIDGDSEKVVLRHQDVEGKRDALGLFNNVIEETASKLVETRKSKVKALVGAFETVISLQDNKPSTPISDK